MKRTTFKLTSGLLNQLHAHLAAEGVGPRAHSKWLAEALEMLMMDDPKLLLPGAGEDLERFDATKALNVTPATEALMDQGIATLRFCDPGMEGVRSALFRAAIKARLAKENPQSELSLFTQ